MKFRMSWRRRAAVITVPVVLATAGTIAYVQSKPPPQSAACHSVSWAGLGVWADGTEGCAGVTDGAKEIDPQFDQRTGGRFGELLAAIHAENVRVEAGDLSGDAQTLCTNRSRSTVDVLAFAPWRSDLVGGRAVHELEGIYVGQWQANHRKQPGGCDPLIRLLVADPGKELGAWKSVVDKAVKDQHLVAAVGLTLSRPETIEAARELNANGVPVIADLVTADGFDRTNFASAPSTCKVKVDPGSNLDRFDRITYANKAYLKVLGDYLGSVDGRLDSSNAVQLTQDGYDQDAFVCTNVQHVNSLIDKPSQPVTFKLSHNGHDSTGQLMTKVAPICADPAVHTIFYSARGLDLANFLNVVDQACRRDITIASGTDTTILLTPDVDPTRENQRKQALEILAKGHIRLLFPATAGPSQLTGTKGYSDFAAAFSGAFAAARHQELFRLQIGELADTWMVNAHDAFFTAASGIHALSVNQQPYTRDNVNSNLSQYTIPDSAQGDLSFDTDGTRRGTPTLLRLCVDAGTAYTQPVVMKQPACTGAPAN